MLHIVEIRRIGSDPEASMAELRAWLADHQIQLAEFEHSTGGPGTTFRVHFIEKSDAEAFADAFKGWLNEGMPPETANLWTIDPPPGTP